MRGDSLKERILRVATIEEVVAAYVPLQRSGAGYVGLCPFHADKHPSLHVSGAIEQVADQVIFVYRAEKYGILYDKDTKEDLRGVGYLLVAKNRNGATGRARFRYNVSMTRFLSYENRLL